MNPATRNDYAWLVTPEAELLLDECHKAMVAKDNIVRIAKHLRKKTTPPRSALVLELSQLRVKATRKFSDAELMFFTKRGYEQSTGELIATHKAQRFSNMKSLADICCGIGGDLQQLANRSGAVETVGVDQDPLMCLFASQNANLFKDSSEVKLVESTFDEFEVKRFDAIHIDPDRRVRGRTVQGNFFQPTVKEIFSKLPERNVGIKLAPATPRPVFNTALWERQWIGTRRECKQQVLWLGDLAVNPECRTATSVDNDGTVEQISISSDQMDQTIVVASELGPYIFEPHPAVLAAGMTDALGNLRGLFRLAPGIAYLTGDRPPTTELLSTFKVIERYSLNIKDVIKGLKKLDAGRVQVKRRGVEQVVADQIADYRFEGSAKFTVILSRLGRKGIAVISKRIRGKK